MWPLLQTILNSLDQVNAKIDKALDAKEFDFLRSLLDIYYEGLNIYWCDTHHRTLLVNTSQALMFNMPPEAMIGKSLFELGDLLGVDRQVTKKISANNEQIMQSKQAILFEEEYNGQTFLSYKSPFFDRSGILRGIIGISTNITVQKELETLLQASKRATDTYLESILMSSGNNIYWVDTESRVVGCNDQQAKIMGLNSRLDLIGKSIFDVADKLGWNKAIAQTVRDNDLKVMQAKETLRMEEKGVFDGEERYFLSCKSPMLDDQGNVIGVLGISTDITTQKATEQALEKTKQAAEAASQSKSQFIANISHDIRTPLVGIQGVAAWLGEQIPEKFQPEINSIINASNELLALLNNVISLTKSEFDEHAHAKAEAFNLYELINRLMDLFSPTARQKQLTLHNHYADDTPQQFLGNPMLIQRALLNLISNALKFTQQGGVTIRVQRDEHLLITDNAYYPILITVEDTGAGIPAQSFETIFERFNRLNPTYQDSCPGSGLGLSIVKQFVENLGGKAWVSSEVGKGSRFFINFPLLINPQKTVAHPPELDDFDIDPLIILPLQTPLSIDQTEIKQSSHLRILLVEDNVLIQKTVTGLLNKLNGYVDIAASAKQALELARQSVYDLIFMDIGLPDEDGFWAAKQIRQLSAQHIDIPIIALTAHLDQEYRDTCLEAGINDIITKPLTLDNARIFLQRYGL